MSTAAQIAALLVPFVSIEAPDQELQLESIEVAMLIESIEDTFDVLVRASQYDPLAFTRLDLLVAWVDRLR